MTGMRNKVNMDIENNEEIETETIELKRMSFMDMFTPVVLLMTVIICTVILVLVINLDKRVAAIEECINTEEGVGTDVDSSLEDYDLSDVSDIYGNSVDESEAVNIAKTASLENSSDWTVKDDSSVGIRRIYLTFDDGPSANTDSILDILDEYGVKATFFVVGKDGYANQYKRIVEDGHTLGMHSYSHKYSEIYSSLEAYKQDLTKLHDFLYELTGVDCNIVRFPGGSSNTVSKVDMSELIAYLDEQNMIYFDWNVSSGDATGKHTSAEKIANNVLASIDKYNNVVVLFHDAAGKESTVEALPIVIESILEADNSVFLPITEDTVKVQHVHN